MDTDFAADRRDTASESGFLCISGRSSRVSSVGSIHSTASIASAASRLSAASNYSRTSRGSSPHRVLLETSFCGPKSPEHFSNRQLLFNDDEEDLSEPTVKPKLADTETQTEPRPKKVHLESVKREIKSEQVKAKVKKTSKPKEKRVMEELPKEKKSKTKPSSKVKVVLDNPKTQKFVPLESLDDDDVEIIQGNAPKQNPVAISYEQPKTQAKKISGENQIYIPLKGDPNEAANPTSPKRLKPFTNPTLLKFINRDPATIESSRRIRRPVRSGSPGIREEFQKFIACADDEADGVPVNPVKLRKQLSIEMTKRKSIDQDCSSRSISPSIFEEFQKFIAEPEDGDVNVTRLENKNRSSAISITSREVQSVVGSGIAATDSANIGRSLSPSIHEEFQKFMVQPDDEEKGVIHNVLPQSAYKIPIEGSPSLSASGVNIRSISPSIYEEFQKFIVEPEGNDNLLPPPPPRKHDQDQDQPRSRSVSPGILDEFQKFINEPDDDLTGRKICDPPPPPRSPQPVNVQVHDALAYNSVVSTKNGDARPKFDPNLVKIVPLKSVDDPNPTETTVTAASSPQDQYLRRRSESSREARPKTGTVEKSAKERRGSSRSLFGSLLQRASSFRGLNRKSPKHKSTSDFADIDPKFTNVEFKFRQEVTENDSVIIPLHSPNDSPDELSDSESNVTKAVVHVSYNPNQEETDKQSTQNSPTASGKILQREFATVVSCPVDIQVGDYSKEMTLNPKPLSPLSCLPNRSVDLVKSNDTSPDSESTLTIIGTEEEKKKLFGQPESVEEELPIVPTTLPQERSMAAPIVPVRHRTAAPKTCSLERPVKCSVPKVDLSVGLETYAVSAAFEEATVVSGKLQIKLPQFKKTPVQVIMSTCSVVVAAEEPVAGRRRRARSMNAAFTSPPPQPQQQHCGRGRYYWTDFSDSCGDKPKSPMKITALPASLQPQQRRTTSHTLDGSAGGRCGCDCHHDLWPAVSRNRSDTT
ncbi:uncharacterized protein LOC126838203 isoform X2 [Adelges cooleyi]|nr:uncharacterized protein LOC126838203 isoform X2 [Adelges cooleyi]